MSKRRGRLRGVEVRPGSVRQARQEAGLSLAQVAGGEVTRAAIHLVESGRSRPSMPTLELIARRTGRPVSFFLSPRVAGAGAFAERLDEMELSLLRGDAERVLEVGRDLGQAPLSTWAAARLNLLTGLAELRLGREEAESHLREARLGFAELKDEEMRLRALIAEADCQLAQGVGAVRTLLEDGLKAAETLVPERPQLVSELKGRLAAWHARGMDVARAAELYREAAQEYGDGGLDHLAAMEEAMAAKHVGEGEPERATYHVHAAIALRTFREDVIRRCRLESDLGEIYLRLGRTEQAESVLRESVKRAADYRLQKECAAPLTTLAEIELGRQDAAAAALALEEAEAMGAGTPGQLAMLRGRLRALQNDRSGARQSLDEALTLLTQAGCGEDVVRCHSIYANLLEEWGETAEALKHAKLALAASRV